MVGLPLRHLEQSSQSDLGRQCVHFDVTLGALSNRFLESFVPDFVAFSPRTEILGATWVAMANALESVGVPRVDIEAWLAARELSPLQGDRWYPLQVYLDFYRWVRDAWGVGTLRSLGRMVPRHAKFPPDLKTLDRVLRTLDIAYQMNQRHGVTKGYLCERIEPRKVHLHCENPYGCDFDTGILEGLFECFATPDSHPTLAHAPGSPCRSKGGPLCIYEVTW